MWQRRLIDKEQTYDQYFLKHEQMNFSLKATHELAANQYKKKQNHRRFAVPLLRIRLWFQLQLIKCWWA